MKISSFLLVISAILLMGCNKHFLGKEYVLVNDGIAGVEVILERQIIYDFDSVYLNSFRYFISGFTLEITTGDEKKVFKSAASKLTSEMKAYLNDDPNISTLRFSDFIFRNKKGELVKLDRNKSIEIKVADFRN